MKTVKTAVLSGLVTALFVLLSCEQPFKAGLGPVVDTRPPTVRLDSPSAGAYIFGQQVFKGLAEDDYKLDRVMIKVTNHPFDYNKYQEYTKATMVSSSDGNWNYTIDTTKFPEGDFKIRLIVYDSVGKHSETDEIAFFVKNQPPTITVASPYVQQSIVDNEGEVGGSHLNYGFDPDFNAADFYPLIYTAANPIPYPTSRNALLPGGQGFKRQADRGAFLSGTIRDDNDIYTAPKDGDRYPPQYRLWLIDDERAEGEVITEDDGRQYKAFPFGAVPTEAQAPWQDLSISDEELNMVGLGSWQIMYKLPSTVGYWGFQIRAQSIDGRTKFDYPRSYWSDATWNGYQPWQRNENSYVLFYIRPPKESPTLALYGKENIFGAFDETNQRYEDVVGVDSNEPHPYVEQNIVNNKNGSFDIWVKAKHSDGISTAEIYWQREDDRSKRGRFIWDWEPGTWDVQGGIHDPNLASLGARSYDYWGYQDPHITTIRNFIFSFDPNGDNTTPDGKSKIQPLKSGLYDSDAAWKLAKEGRNLPTSNDFEENGTPDGEPDLPEGVYKIEVYTYSQNGSTPVSISFTVRVDRTAPTVQITNVVGSYKQDLSDIRGRNTATVNGVIEPRVLISDSLAYDSGLRTSSGDFYTDARYEQFYLLINDGDQDEFEKIAFGKNNKGQDWWPSFIETTPPPPSTFILDEIGEPAISVEKDGAVLSGKFRFKTSPIAAYTDSPPADWWTEETDSLEDGDYWLYVFARDNAFNVGHSNPLKLTVDYKTDRPVFDVRGFDFKDLARDNIAANERPGVLKPSAQDDYPAATHGQGFYIMGADASSPRVLRNKLSANGTIRLTINDDDGLEDGVYSIANSTIDNSGGDQIFVAGALETFNPTVVKQTIGGFVRQHTVTITQSQLCSVLFPSGSVLPDGIYQLRIEIGDNPYSKMMLGDGMGAPAVQNYVDFWFFVESDLPEIDITEPTNVFNTDVQDFIGTVTAQNGPITPTRFEIRQGSTLVNYLGDLKDRGWTLKLLPSSDPPPPEEWKKWVYDINFEVENVPVSGVFSIIMEFEDRFGSKGVFSLNYAEDKFPPVVSLRRPGIPTFIRDGYDDDWTRKNTDPYDLYHDVVPNSEDRMQLANGEEQFVMLATDDSRVEGARWWLVPVGITINLDTDLVKDALTGSSIKEKFDSITPDELIGKIKGTDYLAAELDGRFSATDNYQNLNLSALPDGEYHLWGAAVDGAYNVTVKDLQPIYILKEEDKPYFGRTGELGNTSKPANISPSNGKAVGVNNLNISGTIYDDDGFNTGNATLRIYMTLVIATTDNPLSVIMQQTIPMNHYVANTYTAAQLATAGYSHTAIIPVTEAMIQGKNISLVGVNLLSLFPSVFATPSDGDYHYILEATDNTGQMRRKHFDFKLDARNPYVHLDSPVSGASYGPNAGNAGEGADTFYLKGWIADANLSMENEKYFIDYRVGANEQARIYLGPDTEDPSKHYITGSDPIEDPEDSGKTIKAVHFNIPAAAFTEAIGFFNEAKVPSGNNIQLTIMARDTSGKTGVAMVSFSKDTVPPGIRLNTVTQVELDKNWLTLTETEKRDWLKDEGKTLTVLDASSKTPVLKGTFYDTGSNIDVSTIKYSFDASDDWQSMFTAPLPDNTKNISWEIPLDSLINVEGIHSVFFQAEDVPRNAFDSTQPYGFRINARPPTGDVAEPGAGSEVYGDVGDDDSTYVVFTAKGTASSANLNPAGVQLAIKYTGGASVNATVSDGEWTYLQGTTDVTDFAASRTATITETLEWEANITNKNLADASNNTSGPLEGYYDLTVVSLDQLGTKSNEVIKRFTIDLTPPEFNFGEMEKGYSAEERGPTWWLKNETTKNSRNLVMGSNPSISGRVYDRWSSLKPVNGLIRRYNFTATASDGEWEYYDFGATPGWKQVARTAAENATSTYWTEIYDGGMSEYSLDWKLGDLVKEGGNPRYGYYSVCFRAEDSAGHTALSDHVYFFYAKEGSASFNQAVSSELGPGIMDIMAPNITKISAKKGVLTMAGRISNGNRFETLQVKVEPVNTTATAKTFDAMNFNFGDAGHMDKETLRIAEPWSWQWASPAGEFTKDKYPDGSYRFTFTLTDLSGTTSVVTRVITMDNTPPVAVIESPPAQQNPFTNNTFINTLPENYTAGDIFVGGEEAVISGITEDKGERNSASGVKEVWYHLGYVGNATSAQSVNLPFPTPEQIDDTFVSTRTERQHAENAWFKYAGYVYESDAYILKNGEETPNDDFVIPSNADPFNWIITVEDDGGPTKGIKLLTGLNYQFQLTPPIPPATPPYNPSTGSGPWLAKKIDNYPVSETGLYSMPFYIRVEDFAGNVEYYYRDVWIYPNGDYPRSRFISPAENSERGEARGGMVIIDGMASDNVRVNDVIYRVWVDNQQSAGNPLAANARIVMGGEKGGAGGTDLPNQARVPGMAPALSALNAAALINAWGEDGSGRQTPDLRSAPAPLTYKDGWYRAELDLPGALETPWNIKLNTNDEFVELIRLYGFPASGAVNDTIRIYVEVFVFDGSSSGAYNLMSIGDGLVDTEDRANNRLKPETLVFFLKSTSPKISLPKISEQGATTFNAATVYNDFTQGAVRGGRFGIQATLEGKGRNLGSIAVKRSGESNSNWVTVFGTGAQNLTGLNIQWQAGGTENAVLSYNFDTAQAPGANLSPVHNGAYSATGGKFTLDIRIRDNATPAGMAEYTFELGIDNFAPIADPRNESSKKVAGSDVDFFGRVFDYEGAANTPARVDRVYAWFTKSISGNDQFINLKEKPASPSYANGTMDAAGVTRNSITAYVGREAVVTPLNNPITVTTVTLNNAGTPQQIYYPTGDYLKEINETNAGYLENRMSWQGTDRFRDVQWLFTQDTTIMPDGPMYMNYLVIDQAGNAAYYQQDMVVMNHYPRIDTVTLWTNNRGEGAAFSTNVGDESEETYQIRTEPTGYLNSTFIAKNQTIAFGVTTVSGNLPMHYRVQYVKRFEIPLTSANLARMANRQYGSLTDVGNAAITGLTNVNGINLYTIAKRGDADRVAWESMGVIGEAVEGAHFTYKAAANAFNSDYTATVWAYQNVITAADAGTIIAGKKTYLPGTVANKDASSMVEVPNNLYYVGSNYFGTGDDKIGEHKGSQPLVEESDPDDTAFFLIKAWDTVDEKIPTDSGYNEESELYDAVVVGMNVFLYDSTPPTVRLYDLNPYTETAVTGNNIGAANQTATKNAAMNPRGLSMNGLSYVGNNILRGGLFNVNTERALVKSGHIEPRTGSSALRPRVNRDSDYDNKEGVAKSGTATNADGFVTGDTVGAASAVIGRDQVSGKVILRGLAWDDQLVNEINIQIGTAPAITILKLAGATNDRTLQPVGGAEARAYEYLNWRTGHFVEWAYIWDTEKYGAGATVGAPVTGVTITVSVNDDKGGDGTVVGSGLPNGSSIPLSWVSATNNTVETHNQVTVDIVPYITGFERETPKFATTRSRQGWYSFYQGEGNIAALGYNLKNGNTATTMNIENTAPSANMAGAADTQTLNRIPFTVPAAAQSGKINLTVGGTPTTPAINHTTNHAARSWNREYHSYTSGSDLWVNKPYAHIWRSTQDPVTPATYFPRSEGSSSPGFALQYVTATSDAVGGSFSDANAWVNNSNFPLGTAGLLHGAWATFSRDSFFYSRNDVAAYTSSANNSAQTNGRTLLGIAAEPYMHTDIDYYNNTGALMNNRNLNVAATYWGDGQSILKLKNRMYVGNNNNGGFDATANAGTPSIAWFNANAAAATNRWQNTRVRKAGANTADDDANAGRAYVVSYDAVYRRLLFVSQGARRTAIGGNNNNLNVNYGEMYIDGGTGTQNLGQMPNNNGTTNVGSTTGVAGDAQSSNAGKWAAVDYTTAGYPVIAYYDEANDTLRLARANTNNPTAGNNFTRSSVFPAGHALRIGSGTYVSMRIDKNNRLHLAFWNSTQNTVVYATAPLTNVNNNFPTIGTFEFSVVDTVIKGGTWTDIQVDNADNPWIVYADSTRTGNYDGARIAFKTSGADSFNRPGDPNNGWESVSVPSDYVVNDDRLNIAVWPPTDRSANNGAAGTLALAATSPQGGWNAAVGYGSDMFRIAYFYKPSNTVMGWFNN